MDRDKITFFALENALAYKGKANMSAVVGKCIAENPQLKEDIKQVYKLAGEIINGVNKLGPESMKEQYDKLAKMNPSWAVKEEKKVEEKHLPPLPNIGKYKQVVMRFAPSPSGTLHIGSAYPILLNDEYTKMYNGKFIIRVEDTDPKKVYLEGYQQILDDLEWLSVKTHDVIIQTDRLDKYYNVFEELVRKGHAYVCTCGLDKIKEVRHTGVPCPCRDLGPEETLTRYKKMFKGYAPGEAVGVVKTDLENPNPAVREMVALRIVDLPHARTGTKYRVYPVMNFPVAVDDHDTGLTHVLRGNDHRTNTEKQAFIFRYMGWTPPEYIECAKLVVTDALTSKSKIKKAIDAGEITGWDDPRTATLLAMKRRGIRPEAIRKLILDLGLTNSEVVTLSWENLYAANRDIIEPSSNRYFFVKDPISLVVTDIPFKEKTAKVKRHPDHLERGEREFELAARGGKMKFLVSKDDMNLFEKGKMVRLMEAMNVEIVDASNDGITAKFMSEDYADAKKAGARLIHWLPDKKLPKLEVMMTDGTIASGVAEKGAEELKVDDTVQFERFGFCRIDEVSKGKVKAYYAHR